MERFARTDVKHKNVVSGYNPQRCTLILPQNFPPTEYQIFMAHAQK